MAEKNERFFRAALRILTKGKFINLSCALRRVHQKETSALDFLLKMNFIILKRRGGAGMDSFLKRRSDHSFEPVFDSTSKYLPGQETLSVFPGVSLSTVNVVLGKNAKAVMGQREKVVEFSYVLSGCARAIINDGLVERCYGISPDASYAHFMPGSSGAFYVDSKEPVKMLGIDLDYAFLESLLQGEKCCVCDAILAEPFSLLNQQLTMTPLQRTIVSQLLTCPFKGAARKLFLQGKTLELLAYQIELYGEKLSGKPLKKQETPLNPEEIERIHEARETLRSNMENPPSLQELSVMSGLNLNKLKKGFQTVFKKTAFGCLHEDRMQRAYELLSERRFNVSEVAWEIGYTNVGHFSAAFKKRFSISPKRLQLEIGKRFQ